MRFLIRLCLIFIPLLSRSGIAKEAPRPPVVQANFPQLEHLPQLPVVPKVNVITGEYLEEAVDMVVAGCEPISLRRFYNHRGSYDKFFTYWRYNPEHFCAANLGWKEQEKFIAVGRSDGGVFSYKDFHPDCTVTLKNAWGLTHTYLTGQSHPLNTKVTIGRCNSDGDGFSWTGEIQEGDGTKKKFLSDKFLWNSTIGVLPRRHCIEGPPNPYDYETISPEVWTPYALPFHEERKPNGNIICYTYGKRKTKHYPLFDYSIQSIVAYNSTKSKVLGQLHFSYPERSDILFSAVGSDQRKVVTHKCNGSGDNGENFGLGLVETPHLPTIGYDYRFVGKRRYCINRVEKPEGRVCLTEYEKHTGKVSAQLAPVGEKGKMEYIARFYYAAHYTDHYDAEGNKTTYHFDDQLRITSMVSCEKSADIYRCDHLQWEAATGNLLCKKVENAAGELLFITEYRYDKNHNVIEEKIGDGKDFYTLYRTYSEDGFNLKLSERDDFGRDIRYSYIPNTNLLSAELTYVQDKIVKRLFHFYNDCAVCIKTIVDDGKSSDPEDITDVTFRKITYVTPKESQPCFGLAACIEEKSLDAQGREVSLGKVQYHYTSFGEISQEDHYDSRGIFCYSIKKEYDSRERLVATIDAVGQKTTFTYDANNNLLYYKTPLYGRGFVYDNANRPIESSDTENLTTFLVYDKAGRVVQSTSESGHKTSYAYNSMGKMVAITHPDGAVERGEYDALGNKTKEIDPQGNVTKRTFNFRGQETSVVYPNGSSEYFTYRPDGKLIASVDKNGAHKRYIYTALGQCMEESTYLESGVFVRKNSSTYSAFNLLSTTDALGCTTTFSYDFSGKKIAQSRGETTTYFEYDTLGRLFSEQVGERISLQEYDFLNRTVEKRIENLSHHILWQEKYAYDAHNNRTQVCTSQSSTETVYNGRNEILRIQDPVHNITSYSYTHKSEKTTKITNPKGISKKITLDCRNRKKEVATLNAQGEILQKTSYKYDLNGNEIEVQEDVYEGQKLLKTIIHTSLYGRGNQLLSLCESGQKTTRYEYDEKGRLQRVIKPQVTLTSQYDDLGRLVRYSSTDFSYTYTYDLCDRLLTLTQGKETTRRAYDLYGNLVEETLASGLSFKSSYDQLHQRQKLTLPDATTISYSYHSGYLHEVKRKNFTHTYANRDLEGRITQALLPQKLGSIHLTYDPAGRWKSCTAPFYTAQFPSDAYDSTHNLTHYQSTDALGAQEHFFTYDPLDQILSEQEAGQAHEYSFDSLHNRLSKDGIEQEFNPLNQIIDPSYSYDLHGNLLTYKDCKFAYDSQDRLVEVRKKDLVVNYIYDPFHRRLSKTVTKGSKKTTTRYLWDGENEIGAMNEKNSITELRVLGEGRGAEIGAAVFIELQNKTYVPIHDHRGCLTTLIDVGTNQSVQTCRYTAFGEEFTNKPLSPWRFSSKRVDEETGFLFFGRRYYAPEMGRWLTTDPQGFHDGLNLYAYVHNNPLTHWDLYGLYAHGAHERGLLNAAYRVISDYAKQAPSRTRECNHFLPDFDSKYVNRSSAYSLSDHYPVVKSQIFVGNINGVMNDFKDAVGNAKYLSELLGGIEVKGVHNASNGFGVDLIEAGLNVCQGKMTTPCLELLKQWQEIFAKAPPDYVHLLFCHSQAASQVKNNLIHSPKEIRDRIIVCAIAPATFIRRDLCLEAFHFVSSRDIVPWLDIRSRIGCRDSTTILNPHPDAKMFDHEFQSPTYKDSIIQIFQYYEHRYLQTR